MGWLSQRQSILTQNIANADTPDYRPKDLREADFARLAKGFAGRPTRIAVDRTDPAHVAGQPGARIGLDGRDQRSPYEVAPAGNAVVLEEQAEMAARTALDYQLATNVYKKYVGMVRIALGTPQ
jgi:flagellar basal-body rod protein FlgB